MNSIGFTSPIPASLPAASRPWKASAAVVQPFASQYRSAEAGVAGDGESETASREPLPVRKAIAAPRQSTDPKSAKPEVPVAPVQTVVARQPQDQPAVPILSLSLNRAVVSLESLFGNFNAINGGAPTSTPQGVPQAGSQAAAQLASGLPPIAFSLTLQQSMPSGQTPAGPASGGGNLPPDSTLQGVPQSGSQPASALPPIAVNLPKSVPSSEKPAVPSSTVNSSSPQQNASSGPQVSLSAGGGDNQPSDPGSHQSGAEADKAADSKLGSVTKQDDSPIGIPPVPGAATTPVQAFVNAATHSGTGDTPNRASPAPVADARPIPAPELTAPPVPNSSRPFDLTVPNDAGHHVDIRISQRGADVQVTVRTPDSILAQSLRHNLSDLSENLAKAGLREEVLHTAQSHSSGDADPGDRGRGETPQQEHRQQRQASPEDRGQPASQDRSNNQQAKSFAEAIQTQERID